MLDNINTTDEYNLFNNENDENNEKLDDEPSNKNMEDFMNKLLEVEVDNFNKTDSKLDISTKSDTENNNQDNQEPDQSVKEEEDEQVIIEEEDYES